MSERSPKLLKPAQIARLMNEVADGREVAPGSKRHTVAILSLARAIANSHSTFMNVRMEV